VTVLILGAGMAGLGCARSLHAAGLPYRILEREDGPGGLTRSFTVAGYSFDRTGHYLHSQTPYLEVALRDDGVILDDVERHAAVLIDRSVVPYPVQYNLWALDPERRDALSGRLSPVRGREAPRDFGEMLQASWGPGLCELFFEPYNRKLWGRDLTDLPPDCAGQYMPRVDLARIEAGLTSPAAFAGYNGSFRYPRSGRFGDAAVALARRCEPHTSYCTTATSIDRSRRLVTTQSGETIRYEQLVSTLPLPALLRLLGLTTRNPDHLTATSIRNIRVGFRGRALTRHQWLYVPDEAAPFYRVGLPVNVNPVTCPAGTASLSIECGVRAGRPVLPAEAVVEAAVARLEAAGVIEVDAIEVTHEITLDPAYVVFRSTGRPVFDALRDELAGLGIHLAGRYGTWEYLSMDQAFKSGLDAAWRVVGRRTRTSHVQTGAA